MFLQKLGGFFGVRCGMSYCLLFWVHKVLCAYLPSLLPFLSLSHNF